MTTVTDNAIKPRPKPQEISKLRIFLPFIKPYWRWAAIGAFALVLTAAMSLIIPIFMGRIFDELSLQTGELDARTFILAAFVAVGMAVGAFMRVYFVQNLAHRVIADIRAAVFSHIIGLSRSFFDGIKSGEVVSRLAGDATIIGTVLTNNISMAARHALTFTGGLVMMIYTSPYLTGLVSLIVPVIIIPLAIISRQLARLSRTAQDALAEGTSLAAEAIQGVLTVQSFAQESKVIEGYTRQNEAHYRAHKRRILTFACMVAFMILVMLLATIMVFWVGAQQVRAGEMTGGTLVQFAVYAMMVGGGVQSFSDIWSELMRAVGAGERLAELLGAEEDLPLKNGRETPVAGAPLLALENVDFAYPGLPDRLILKDISFALEEGKVLALVGPSGAGKSTVLQLLLRHYDPVAGMVRLRGQDIRELPLQTLRRNFAYVTQEPAIFAMSIAENIAFSRPNATENEIIEAAKAAFAHDFIMETENGYQSYVGERGVLLSGGQKARLALARAFLSDAPILLLDEATAALDAESEHYVQKAVENLRQNRSVIAIAHRLATVKSADTILVFQDGQIVDRGTHQSLQESSALYAKLTKMQFLGN